MSSTFPCIPLILFGFLLVITNVKANVTVYATTGTAAQAIPTACYGAVPCDGRVLTPLANPGDGNFSTSITIQLLSGGMTGLSIPLDSSFAGFSIELSVANQISTSI